jgi:hypothetical protein
VFILLSELKTVRLICRSCQVVVELPVDRLDRLPPDFTCPVCHHYFPRKDPLRGTDDYLALLATAVRGLEREGQAVEFVVERGGRATPPAMPPAP